MTMGQTELWEVLADLEREDAERARDEALSRVEANADREWKAQAKQAVLWLAHHRREFTSDDVWRLLDGRAVTHEPRALGAVLLGMARAGVIRKTDRVVNSTRAECHARPVAVWWSLVEVVR